MGPQLSNEGLDYMTWEVPASPFRSTSHLALDSSVFITDLLIHSPLGSWLVTSDQRIHSSFLYCKAVDVIRSALDLLLLSLVSPRSLIILQFGT